VSVAVLTKMTTAEMELTLTMLLAMMSLVTATMKMCRKASLADMFSLFKVGPVAIVVWGVPPITARSNSA
jgi:hypothetical protein